MTLIEVKRLAPNGHKAVATPGDVQRSPGHGFPRAAGGSGDRANGEVGATMADDQGDVVAFLGNAASYGLTGQVETIETHISRVFLVGDRAFKLKRAVKLPYVDFSTPALRIDACRKEVALNAAGAPGLYLGIRIIRRGPDGALVFGGRGKPVDAVVEMVRFDQAALADRLALAGQLTPALMGSIARMVASFHDGAPAVHAEGGAANIAAVLSINEAGFATSRVFLPAEIAALSARFRADLARHASRLDRRQAAGKVRRCHGDLHLRNICVIDGQPRLFDCIEFNEQIATIDTLYDLAFLLMDLWHRGFQSFANHVANLYLNRSDNEDGFVLLPFFMAVRAAVRAHVTATQADAGGPRREELAAEAKSYFDLAGQLLDIQPPRLIAIGGLSGSGKSTLAEALAAGIGAPPGARIIESDRVRKALHGVDAETRLPAEAYRPEISQRVYGEMAERTGHLLADGASIVVNAVFDRLADREMIEMVASLHKTPFAGWWLEADPAMLRQRVAKRAGGPSDADIPVLDRQLARPVEPIGWRHLDAAAPLTALVAQASRMEAAED
jgi:aminoglycoside phosphotransferase family enzyme/predicted kinase